MAARRNSPPSPAQEESLKTPERRVLVSAQARISLQASTSTEAWEAVSEAASVAVVASAVGSEAQESGPAQALTDCLTISRIVKESKAASGQVAADRGPNPTSQESEAPEAAATSPSPTYNRIKHSER